MKKLALLLFLLVSMTLFSQTLSDTFSGKWSYATSEITGTIEFNADLHTCSILRWNGTSDVYKYTFVKVDSKDNLYIGDFLYLVDIQKGKIILTPRFEAGDIIILKRF